MQTATAKTLHGPGKGPNGDRSAVLSGEASAILRNQLLAEIAGLEAHDDLDTWTLRAWPKANTLTPADGDQVKLAFQARLGHLQSIPHEDPSPAERDQPTANQEIRSRIDKSVLAIPVARRLRDETHLRFVAKQPCLVCGRQPCDAHHLRFAQSRGLSLKVSDEFTVPRAALTIANCTAPAGKPTGGRKPVSSPSAWRASCGWKPTPSPLLQTSWATTAKSPERRTK